MYRPSSNVNVAKLAADTAAQINLENQVFAHDGFCLFQQAIRTAAYILGFRLSSGAFGATIFYYPSSFTDQFDNPPIL